MYIYTHIYIVKFKKKIKNLLITDGKNNIFNKLEKIN